jgi:hypothetical protein
MSNKNIWYLPGPFHQYQEDVKALAKEAGLRIIDANVTEGRADEASNTPEVTLKEAMPQLIADNAVQSDLDEENGNLRTERDGIRGLIESMEGVAPLEHPGAGELPIRLFYALSGIHAGMTELAGARDGLAAENERLRNEIAELKAGDGQEVEVLKAALDAAGVTYRANASKESLEKLVSELPRHDTEGSR